MALNSITVSEEWKDNRAQLPDLLNSLSTPPLHPCLGNCQTWVGGRAHLSSWKFTTKARYLLFPPTSILSTRPRLDQSDTRNEDSAAGKVIPKKHLEEELVLPGAAAPRHRRATGQQRAACFWILVPKPRMVTTCLLSQVLFSLPVDAVNYPVSTRLSPAEPISAACKPASTPTC